LRPTQEGQSRELTNDGFEAQDNLHVDLDLVSVPKPGIGPAQLPLGRSQRFNYHTP
jgi:hypothetical protein